MQVGDDAPELPAGDRVDSGRWLVEQEQVGLVHECGRERELLLHAARQVLGVAALERRESRELERGLGAPGPLGLGHTPQPREEVEVLAHGEVLIERKALRHVADARLDASGLSEDRRAEDLGVAFVGREHRCEQPNQRRLARAVGADEAEDLASADLKIDVIDSDQIPEPVSEPARDDSVVGRGGRGRGVDHGGGRSYVWSRAHSSTTSTGIPGFKTSPESSIRTRTS